jgi:hypothetical protein
MKLFSIAEAIPMEIVIGLRSFLPYLRVCMIYTFHFLAMVINSVPISQATCMGQ